MTIRRAAAGIAYVSAIIAVAGCSKTTAGHEATASAPATAARTTSATRSTTATSAAGPLDMTTPPAPGHPAKAVAALVAE